MEEPIYIIEELMDQCLNKYLQEQTTQDKTSLKDLTNMAAQVSLMNIPTFMTSWHILRTQRSKYWKYSWRGTV